ncbi:hypothetical protein AB5I39_09935 [Sphingomonas sp. MMS24-J45]|uniref:hypothetical protein n=1 Tax=Sphingomonas sp. MMS24-J45 TaxID=3238806 RepID=UPI00384B6A3A
MDHATLLKAAQRLVRPDERILLPDFISEDDRRHLLDWAFSTEPYLRENGPARLCRKTGFIPHIDAHYHDVRLAIQRRMGLPEDSAPEPDHGWLVSIIRDSGAVHPHTDSAPPGTRHLRCNLFLQLPDAGGRPVIAGIPIDVTERMVLAFYPSERMHWSEPCAGDRARVMLSFGYLVPADYRLPG